MKTLALVALLASLTTACGGNIPDQDTNCTWVFDHVKTDTCHELVTPPGPTQCQATDPSQVETGTLGVRDYDGSGPYCSVVYVWDKVWN